MAGLKEAARGHDPYLAAEAVRSLIAIVGIEELHETVDNIAGGTSFMPAAVAKQALAERGHQ